MKDKIRDDFKHFGNQYIFSAIYITEGNRFLMDLDALISEYEESIDFALIGFPSNWKELLGNLNNIKS